MAKKVHYIVRHKKKGESSGAIGKDMKISTRRINQVWKEYRETGEEPVIGEELGTMKMLDEALFHNRVSQDSYRDKTPGQHDKTKQPPLKKVFEEGEFTQNYKELFENKRKMFHIAFIVILWGKNKEALREAESHVTIVLESNRIYYEVPDYRHLDTLIAAQPYPQWVDYSWIELFSYHTAALLPTRNPNSKTDG